MSPGVPSRRHSITYRMTAAVCAFIILFLSLLTAVFLYYFKYELKQTISNQQLTLLTVVAQDIDQKLLSAQKTLVAVAQEVPPGTMNDPEAAQRFLNNRPGTISIFDHGLTMLSRDGRIIAESQNLPGRRGRDLSFREFYKKTIATGRPVISAPFISTRIPGAPLIIFTAPVRDKSGAVTAMLLGGLNLQRDNILGELSRTRIAKSGYLYLFTSDRTMVMHPDRSRIMTTAAPPGTNKLFDRALNGFEGIGENVNSKGLHALTSFKRLQATDWIIAANYPLDEVYEPIYRVQKFFFVAVILSAFFTVLVVRMLMGSYTHALVEFARHVKEISSKKGKARLFKHDSEDEIGILARTFNSMIQDYDRSSEELFHISTHDSLTGLYNRAFFDDEMKRFSSGRIAPVSVVMADVDDLKVCNDTYGHPVGDALIKATAQTLLDCFRSEDAVARIGGDEFAVLLPGVDAAQAEVAMKRVRSMAEKYETVAGGIPMSISLGCATAENPADLDAAFKHADQQMYLDKLARKVEKESEL